jgi:hypothetical protein
VRKLFKRYITAVVVLFYNLVLKRVHNRGGGGGGGGRERNRAVEERRGAFVVSGGVVRLRKGVIWYCAFRGRSVKEERARTATSSSEESRPS